MILAIDIGGTFIKFGLVDDDFSISNQSIEPTPTTIDDFWWTLDGLPARLSGLRHQSDLTRRPGPPGP